MSDKQPCRFVVFGASITAFRGPLRIMSFILEDYLNARGLPVKIFNCGVPGNNTIMAQERFDRDVLGLAPDLVLMSFGTNDSMIDVFQGVTVPRVPLESYRENFRRMIRELKKRNIIPVIFPPPPLVWTPGLRELYGKPPYTEHGFNFMLDQYVAALKALAIEENAAFIDINRRFMELTGGDEYQLRELLSDGMHPGTAGQQLIAETIKIWFDQNLPLLALNAFPDVETIDIIAPENRLGFQQFPYDEIPQTLPLRLHAPSNDFDTMEVRYKNHDLVGPAPRTCSPWKSRDFSIENGILTSDISLPASGCYTLQVRMLLRGELAAVGKQDFVWAGEMA